MGIAAALIQRVFLAAAAFLCAAAPAHAAEAIFQGIVTCRMGSSAADFSSVVTARVSGGMLDFQAADPNWSMGSGKDFSRRDANSHVVFEHKPVYGRIGFYFAGGTSHIRVQADAAGAALTIKRDGGVTICGGALPLAAGNLADALVR